MKKKDIFICECSSSEHQIIVRYDNSFGDGIEVYCDIHLVHSESFWKRVKKGLRYIFGYRCKYGHWDEFILNPEDADKLQEVVDYLKKKPSNVIL